MKYILIITVLLFNFIIKAQTFEISGNILQDTIWNADTIKITGDIYVYPNATLTILPGTLIEIEGYFKMDISGAIKANGEYNDTIFFTVNDTNGMWTDTTSILGGWDGFHIENNDTSTSIFSYCDLRYGKSYYTNNNYHYYMGGALIRCKNYGKLIVENCKVFKNMLSFEDNVTKNWGGALFCYNVDSVIIHDNIFKKNRAFEGGGAISISKNCLFVNIYNNYFIKNTAYYKWHYPWGWVTGGYGAAIHSSDNANNSPIIYDNYFYNNLTLNGIIYTSNLYPLVYNNIVCNNEGSGIMDGHQLSSGKIFNNTIVNNKTIHGGIDVESKAIVYNNIVWGNLIDDGNDYDQIFLSSLSNPILFNNCVQFGNGGTDSIMEYPQFINPTAGAGLDYDGLSADWTLLETSPCINAGTPDTTGLNLPLTDIAGNPRVYGNRIDMGAYENQTVWVYVNNNAPVAENIKVYPNPGNDKIFINLPHETENATFEIVNGMGNVLIHTQINNRVSTIYPYKLPQGIYYYRIFNVNKVFKTGKWIKTGI